MASTQQLDPRVRQRLFPNDPPSILPFDDFVRKELRLQRSVHVPRVDQSVPPKTWRNWKVGDDVMINFGRTPLTRGYDVKYELKLDS